MHERFASSWRPPVTETKATACDRGKSAARSGPQGGEGALEKELEAGQGRVYL
jgi:hypothetical protein